MRKYLLMVLFCVGLFGFGGMTKAAEWTDISSQLPGTGYYLITQISDGNVYVTDGQGKIYRQNENDTWTQVANGKGSDLGEIVQAKNGVFYGLDSDVINNPGIVWKYENNSWVEKQIGANFYHSGSFASSSLANSRINNNIYILVKDSNPNQNCPDVEDPGPCPRLRIWEYNSNFNLIFESGLSEFCGFDGCWISIGNFVQGIDGKFIISTEQGIGRSLGSNYLENIGGCSWYDFDYNGCPVFLGNDGTVYLGSNSRDSFFETLYPRIYKYTGDSWVDTKLATNAYGEILSIIGINNVLYAGGYEVGSGGYNLGKVWVYSNNSWSEIGSFDSRISQMLAANNGIYALTSADVNVDSKIWKYAFPDQQVQQNNLENGDKVFLKSGLNKQTISGQNLVINFTKLPTKLTKNSAYWMKWNNLSKYPNKTFLSNWKLSTNLYKYKVKKSSQKYKIKVTFKYTKKALKKYLKKNKSATKSNLYLKYKQGTSSWTNLSTAFPDAKVIKKGRKFIVKYFTRYPVKKQHFAIGVR